MKRSFTGIVLVCIGCGSSCQSHVNPTAGESSSTSSESEAEGGPSSSTGTPSSSTATESSSSQGNSESSGSTGSAVQDACGDRPLPHLCSDDGRMCLCPQDTFGLTEDVALGDVDGDGLVDLAYTVEETGTLLRLSDGTAFGEPVLIDARLPRLVGGDEHGIAFVLVEDDATTAGIVGISSFEHAFELGPLPGEMVGVYAGDVDGDGTLDLLFNRYDRTRAHVVTVRGLAGESPLQSTLSRPHKSGFGFPHIILVEDDDGDGDDDVLFQTTGGACVRLVGSSTGLSEGQAVIVDGFESVLSPLHAFEASNNERHYLQPLLCSDCAPPFGGYRILARSGGAFTIVESSAGDPEGRLGNAVRVLSTQHGHVAVALTTGGEIPLGTDAASHVGFQALGGRSPGSYVTIPSNVASIKGVVALDGQDLLLASVGVDAASAELKLFSLEVL